MNSITGIIIGLEAILFLVCGVRIYQAFIKTRDKSVGYFAKFFIIAGLGFIIMASASKIAVEIFVVKIMIITGLFLLLTGMAYFTKLTVNLIKPRLENAAFWGIMVGNIVTVLAMTKFYLFASTREPFLDQETKVLVINFPSIVTLLFFLLIIITMVVPGIIFLIRSLRSQDKRIRARGLIIGLGLFFFAVGSLSCTMSREVFSMQISQAFLMLAFLPFLLGVFYVTEKKIPDIILGEKEMILPPKPAF